MAEKEERYISITQMVAKENIENEKYQVMPRQDAINRMAKGIHYYEWAHSKHFPQWNELNDDIKEDYCNMAEAALNALLEVK